MVSVIVPIYNAEKYLRECLDSLVNQTYKDLEVIMVNDGSTDSSKAICEEYERKYPNFSLINKENGGQMSAWILGIQQAKGEYFGFVDSDDFVAPDMYEKMVACEEKTNADVVMCDFYDYDKANASPRHKRYKAYYSEQDIYEIYEKVFPTMSDYFSASRWDKLFKRDIYLENTRKYCDYVARTFEDRFIVIPYLFSCKSFAYIDEPLYYWRKRKVSSSRKPRPELMEIVENLFIRQKQALIDKELYSRYQDHLEIGKIDLIRCAIERNIVSNCSKQEKLTFASQVLTKENRAIVLKHKNKLQGKFGKFMVCVCFLNSKYLLIKGKEWINSMRPDRTNENAFD